MRKFNEIHNCMFILAAVVVCASSSGDAVAGDPTPPPPVPGVCCAQSGPGCTPATNVLVDCFAEGRPYIIGGTCTPVNSCAIQGAGACCRGGGLCIENYAATACESDGGIFQGAGTTCSPNPCGVPAEACCFDSGACTEVSPSQCATDGGITLFGQSCDGSPCGSGACCTGVNCVVANAYTCTVNGYSFQGAGTVCEPDPCGPNTGACCYGDTSCFALTLNDCTETGGTFQGSGTNCLEADCGTAACCFGEGGGCILLSAAQCANQGGILLGGPTCEDNPCGVGACCTNNNCVQVEAYTCLFNGYSYQGAGVACEPGLCFTPCICISDMNGDFHYDALDIQGFVACLIGESENCSCADTDGDSVVTPADIGQFINTIMNTTGECL